MATLTYKVRLGITKGWRVRSLNQVKFYVQTVAHCLFIFTSLRLRGYQDKIWTLNYTVFLMRSKYLLYIEFIVLPRARKWARGYGKSSCFGFTTRIRLKIDTRIVKFTPNVLLGRFIRAGFKKTRAVALQGVVWGWSYKMTLVKVLLRIHSSDANLSVLGAVSLAKTKLTRSITPLFSQSTTTLLARLNTGLVATPTRRFKSIMFTTQTPLLLRGSYHCQFKRLFLRLKKERQFISTKRKVLLKNSRFSSKNKKSFVTGPVFQRNPSTPSKLKKPTKRGFSFRQ